MSNAGPRLVAACEAVERLYFGDAPTGPADQTGANGSVPTSVSLEARLLAIASDSSTGTAPNRDQGPAKQ